MSQNNNPEHVQICALLKKLIWAVEDLKKPLDDICTELNLKRKNF